MSMNTLITLEVKFYRAVLCEGLGLGLEFFKKVLTTTLPTSVVRPSVTRKSDGLNTRQHIRMYSICCRRQVCPSVSNTRASVNKKAVLSQR